MNPGSSPVYFGFPSQTSFYRNNYFFSSSSCVCVCVVVVVERRLHFLRSSVRFEFSFFLKNS